MDLELTPNKSDDDAEIDTPPHNTHHTYNPSSFTTAVVKNRHHQPPPAMAYKECMKNHAAGLGGHAVDGCCEYMPHSSCSAAPTDPTFLKCAACGCHRNFHRRQPDSTAAAVIAPPFLDFRLPPAQLPKRTSPSTCTSPASVSELPCGHTLLALSTAVVVASEEHHQEPLTPTGENNPAGGRKRSRTKFSREQKEKMHSFSEKIGWKMHKSDEAAAEEFCRENGVSKSVLRVWMHNHKNAFGKKGTITTSGTAGGVIIDGKLITSSGQNNNGGNSSSENEEIINNIDKWQSFSE